MKLKMCKHNADMPCQECEVCYREYVAGLEAKLKAYTEQANADFLKYEAIRLRNVELEAEVVEQATELKAIAEFVADETDAPAHIVVEGTEYVLRDIVRTNRRWLLETHQLLMYVCKCNRESEAKLSKAREALERVERLGVDMVFPRTIASIAREALTELEVEG